MTGSQGRRPDRARDCCAWDLPPPTCDARICRVACTAKCSSRSLPRPEHHRGHEPFTFLPLPVTDTYRPVTHCQICHRDGTYQPGNLREVLTGRSGRAHPGALSMASRQPVAESRTMPAGTAMGDPGDNLAMGWAGERQWSHSVACPWGGSARRTADRCAEDGDCRAGCGHSEPVVLAGLREGIRGDRLPAAVVPGTSSAITPPCAMRERRPGHRRKPRSPPAASFTARTRLSPGSVTGYGLRPTPA
jgi:hypothetical protein